MTFQRIDQLPQYIFDLVAQLVQETCAQGHDVIDLSLGNPDGGTPSFIVDALINAVQRPETHRYSKSKGIEHLRQALANWAERHYQLSLNPENEVVATIGAKEGIAHLALAITGAHDKVLVPMPRYPIHECAFKIAECDVLHYDVSQDQQITLDNIKQQIRQHPIKVLIANFPSNPTGACVDLDFFEEIIHLAKKNQFWVIHDLAYADICFDGYKAPSILQVAGAKDVAVEVFSLSKSFNMPGWRVGFVYGNAHLIHALSKIKTYYDYGMFTPIQVAASTALNDGDTVSKEICKLYETRRDVLCQALHDIGWYVPKPKATMFVWAPIPQPYRELGSLQFTEKLIKEAHVAVSPGIGFGEKGNHFVRLALIETPHRMTEALSRIDNVLKLPQISKEEKKFGTG